MLTVLEWFLIVFNIIYYWLKYKTSKLFFIIYSDINEEGVYGKVLLYAELFYFSLSYFILLYLNVV